MSKVDLFSMPLNIDKFLGGSIMMTTRMKLNYLWGIICLWKNPKIQKDDFLMLLEDGWGGEIPERELGRIMAKFDLDEEGFVFSERVESVRLETMERTQKNNAKRAIGGEVTALQKAGYDKATARKIAIYATENGITRSEAIAKLELSLSQGKAENKPSLTASLTQGKKETYTDTDTNTLKDSKEPFSESAQAHAHARPQTAVPTFYNPPITYPERADFVAYGMTHLGHVGLTDKDWNAIFSEAVASEWKDVNGKPWGNWKGKIVHKAKDYAKAKESGERDPDMLTKNLSKSMLQGLLMDKQKELTPHAFEVDENGFETFDPDKIVEPKGITA